MMKTEPVNTLLEVLSSHQILHKLNKYFTGKFITSDSLVANFRTPSRFPDGALQSPTATAQIISLLAGVDLPLTVGILQAFTNTTETPLWPYSKPRLVNRCLTALCCYGSKGS